MHSYPIIPLASYIIINIDIVYCSFYIGNERGDYCLLYLIIPKLPLHVPMNINQEEKSLNRNGPTEILSHTHLLSLLKF